MGKQVTINVRLTNPLSEHVERQVGADALFDNVSEYVRDLIRRDKEQIERRASEALRDELQAAFAAPAESYVEIDPENYLEKVKSRRTGR